MRDIKDTTNTAIKANEDHRSAVENASDYVENFDILETINNVGNDEVFTPRKICSEMLDSLPEEVWHNKDYKWLNPCTKNGVFEREIAIRLDEGLKDVIPNEEERRKHILTKMIFSIGQTKFTSHVARRTLYYCTEANRRCDGIKASDGHYVNGYAIGNGTWFDTEEGNILTPCTDHEFDSSGENAKCKYCGIKKNSSYVDPLQREQYAYEFIHVNHLVLQKHLQERFFGGNKDMKFDIIIGNPPYQLSTTTNGGQATPIYDRFVDLSIRLKPKYLCMITPSRWYAGGMGLDDYRKYMMNSRKISLLVDFADSAYCFPSVANIAGGVSFFVWDRDYEGDCKVINSTNNRKSEPLMRPLNEFSFFARDNKSISILRRVSKTNKKTLNELVYSINSFDVLSNAVCSDVKKDGFINCYTLNGLKYIEKNRVADRDGLLNMYKVMFTKTMSGGNKPSSEGNYKVLSTIITLEPGEICTDTYLCAGRFDNETEANNLNRYLTTKFARFLLLQGLSSIHITKDKFLFVPFVDFKEEWDDQKLYDYFDLTFEERLYIESTIKEMN